MPFGYWQKTCLPMTVSMCIITKSVTSKVKTFTQQSGIWLLELDKFKAKLIRVRRSQRWLQFFKVGEQLNDESLPDGMITQHPQGASPIRYPSDGL